MSVLSVSGKSWILKKFNNDEITHLKDNFLLDEIISKLLSIRKIKKEDINSFLNPSIKNFLPNPDLLVDMEKTTKRTIEIVNNKEKIGIFGDYDVDGATSTSLLGKYFSELKLQYEIYIPDRKKEGYGPTIKSFTELIKKGVKIIFTVDCGTLSFEAINFAKKNKIDVIVLDHHQSEIKLPEAFSVINPNRLDDKSNLQYLCAAGVVFLTLVECGRQIKSQNKNTPNLMEYLDLVALGTVADVAPLIGVNRAFVRQGLKILSTRQRLGLQMLIDKSGLNSTPTSYHLGYILGPKLNEPGRIGPSDLAIKLLCSNSISEATNLCEEIEELNLKRKEIENNVREEALEKVEKNQAKNSIIWAAAEGWHPGVVGIVASRLKDKFNKPALVIGFDGIAGKGSGRSVDGYDLGFAIQRLQREGLIQKGGGHKMAAGLSLKKDQLQTAMHRLCELAEKDKIITPEAQEVPVDGILFIQAVNIDLIEELENCGPFGSAIREPRFAFCDVSISFAKRVGDTHLKVRFSDDNGKSMDAICFRAFEGNLGAALAEHGGKKVHLAGKLDINYWQGKKSPQLIIDDAAWPEKL